MITDLQKASLWKRISAVLLDFILLSILVVGMATLLSVALGYNGHIDSLNESYAQYETQYGVEFQISQSEYEAMSEQQQKNYDTAYQALTEDENVVYTYNILINLTILIATFSILISVVVIEFVVPLFFGNGQTLGKKIFGICLMRTDSIQVSNAQLFIRAVLGKFTLELMIPIYILIMIFFNTIGIVGIVILAALALGQVICIATTKTNAPLHDVLTSTVVVDMASQMIFRNQEELLEYTKKIHAERAAQSDY